MTLPFYLNWFYETFMVLNPDRCSFTLLDITDELETDLASNVIIKNSKEEKKYWESQQTWAKDHLFYKGHPLL